MTTRYILLLLIVFGLIASDAKIKKKEEKNLNNVKQMDTPLTQNMIDEMGQVKIKAMEEKEAKSSNGIINFTPKEYMDLVFSNPRPYDVVMIFNVKQGCDHCLQVESEYKHMVYSFLRDRGVNEAAMDKNRKIFFGSFYFSSDKEVQKLFKSQGLTTVPFVAISQMNLKRDANLENFFAPEDLWLVSAQEVFDAQKQIDFVNSHLHTDVQIKFTLFSIITKNLLLFAILAGLFNIIKQLYPFLMNQMVWFTIAILVWIICTAGVVYSTLNNMPWFRYERNEYGSVVITEYFMRGQRGQWAGEGYIVSILTTLIGLGYLYMMKLDKVTDDKSQIRVAVIVLIFALWVMQQMLVSAYRIKSPWYNPHFMPPDYYQTGSLLKDQGNSIIDLYDENNINH